MITYEIEQKLAEIEQALTPVETDRELTDREIEIVIMEEMENETN